MRTTDRTTRLKRNIASTLSGKASTKVSSVNSSGDYEYTPTNLTLISLPDTDVDTDNDGFPDQVEALLGTDQADPASFPTNVVYETGTFLKQDSVHFDPSLWAPTNGTINWSSFPQQIPYSEEDVFHTQLSHTATVPSDRDWILRIGKGGQIYSIDMEGLGQIICPQRSFSPWNDDCMTTTLYSDDVANKDPEMGGNETFANGYIHGSGMYIKPHMDPINNKPFYCPNVGERFDDQDKSYTMINLGLVPKPSINRSDVLFYSKYTDLDHGVLELTFYCYNFGDRVYNFAETPWFAVRPSKFPNMVEGIRGTQSFKLNNKTFQSGAISKRGGWGAYTLDPNDPNSLSCGLVWGSSGAEFMAINFGVVDRNVRDMSLMAPSVNSINMPYGTGIKYRRFLVFGKLTNVADMCSKLNEFAFFEKIDFSSTNADTNGLYLATSEGQPILTNEAVGTKIGSVYSIPVKDSLPLFLMKNNDTNQYCISTDPYAICGKLPFTNPYPLGHAKYDTYQNRHIYQPYDGKTEWIKLLGFAVPLTNSQVPSGFVKLSDVASNVSFIAGEKLNASELAILTA